MLCTDVCLMPVHNRVGVIWPIYTLPYASFYLQIQICLEWWICAERPSAININFNVSWVFPSLIINRSNASLGEMDEPPLQVWFMFVHDLLQVSYIQFIQVESTACEPFGHNTTKTPQYILHIPLVLERLHKKSNKIQNCIKNVF